MSIAVVIALLLIVGLVIYNAYSLSELERGDLSQRPARLRSLPLLAVAPVHWFARHLQPLSLPALLLLAWGMGTLKAMDYTDAQVFKENVGVGFNLWQPVWHSWAAYWLWVLGIGLAGGLLVWVVGYWWYRLRLRFSGVRNVDSRRLRTVYFLTELWVMIPVFGYTLLNTFRYDNVDAAWVGDGGAPTAVIAMAYLLSLVISFFAVATVYPVRRGRALFWFLVFPLLPVYFDLISIFARM